MSSSVHFAIAPETLERFPECAAGGFIVENLQTVVSALTSDRINALWQEARSGLEQEFPTAEAIPQHPAIAPWRQAYAACGLKPSSTRSSHEQVIRRLLGGKPIQTPLPVVDAYCALSAKYLAPLGATDLDRIRDGQIMLRPGQPETDRFEPLGAGADQMPVTDRVIVYACNNEVLCWSFNHRDSARTCLTPETTRALFMSEAVSIDRHDALRTVLGALAELLRECGASVGSVDVATAQNGGVIEFSNPQSTKG